MMPLQRKIESWGRLSRTEHSVFPLFWIPSELPALSPSKKYLPFGEGRSYGDSCLNSGGALLATRDLKRFIAFDSAKGILACESGVRLDEIVALTLPQGWFLPVSPGTQFVTLGGAIANDIHGKNHHVAGTFGRFVRRFALLRSEGLYLCSASENKELFEATIGGLGLTGLILWAEIQLKPAATPWIEQETIRFPHLDEFFEISEESEREFEYTVSWIDTLARGKSLGRGHFMRGNHSLKGPNRVPKNRNFKICFEAPSWLLNPLTVGLFNQAYYFKQIKRRHVSQVYYQKYFYPLDSIYHWNRLYGKRGFFQYQLVVPFKNDREPIKEILRLVARSRQASFLAVLKTFGSIQSPGWMSFPREGVTLALDFPNHGTKTQELFLALDRVVRESRGALYPAKDASMLPEDFKGYYPEWERFSQYVDPNFSSSFWRRVLGG